MCGAEWPCNNKVRCSLFLFFGRSKMLFTMNQRDSNELKNTERALMNGDISMHMEM